MATAVELAWAAGFFEGEGCIHMNKQARKTLGMVVSNCDEDVLRRFHEIVGCGTFHGPYKQSGAKEHWKPFWRWQTSSWDAIALCEREEFVSHLGERRKKKLEEILREVNDPSNPPPRRGWRATHCLRGHLLDEENTRWYRGKCRSCRACERGRQRAETLFKRGIISEDYIFSKEKQERLLGSK